MRGGMAVREGEVALLYALSSCMHVFVALILMIVDLIKVHASGLQTVCLLFSSCHLLTLCASFIQFTHFEAYHILCFYTII